MIRRPTSPIWSSPASARSADELTFSDRWIGIVTRAVLCPFASLRANKKPRLCASGGIVN